MLTVVKCTFLCLFKKTDDSLFQFGLYTPTDFTILEEGEDKRCR